MSIRDLLSLNEHAAFTLLGEAATYTPSGGDAVSIRVMPAQPDEEVSFGDTQIHTATTAFEIRVAELEDNSITPAAGDKITYDSTSYTVSAPPSRDERRRLWTLETVPTTAPVVPATSTSSEATVARITNPTHEEVEPGVIWSVGWWQAPNGSWWKLVKTADVESFTRDEADFYLPAGPLDDVPEA